MKFLTVIIGHHIYLYQYTSIGIFDCIVQEVTKNFEKSFLINLDKDILFR
ncbi:hypothetical protein SDC9_177837 [bioreactor metagenome]|uniref:Uncharacterized protein n=1 Tax=bioreactor metagenome TaxID=1076179 RepID=A0A645GVS7_9ZZZZ